MRGCRDSTCSPWRTPCRSRWRHPKEAVTPWEACAGASSWQDLWPCGERSPHWSRFVGRTCDPVGVKNCSLWEGLTLEKLVEDCLPWEGPHAGAGAECEESFP